MKPKRIAKFTDVSPYILRQVPLLKEIANFKRLNCSVSFDSLSIMTSEINDNYLNEETRFLYDFSSNQFSNCQRRRLNSGIGFSILAEPKFPTQFPYLIQINPSNFLCLDELLAALQSLACKSLNDDNHKVTRLDIAFTSTSSLISPEIINLCGRYKWKRSTTRYRLEKHDRGVFTGFSTNSSTMNIVCYDKSEEQKYRTKNSISPRQMNRYELQLKQRTLLSIGLNKIEKLKSIDVDKIIDRFEFYNPVLTTATTSNEIDRFKGFQYDVLYNGFHQARAKNNKSRNFDRDFKKLLVPLKINNDKAILSNCLKKRFKEWHARWIADSSTAL